MIRVQILYQKVQLQKQSLELKQNTQKMSIIGLEEHSVAPERVPWGVQESEH